MKNTETEKTKQKRSSIEILDQTKTKKNCN